MKKIYQYIKHNWTHKISFWNLKNLKNKFIEYGPLFVFILIIVELFEHFGLPVIFYWLGGNIHEAFYALVPTPLFICLHFLTTPIIFFIYVTITRRSNKRKKKISEFQENVLKLFSSISISQLIPFIITPILMQFFSAEAFGLYGLYITICTILGTIACGKYDTAIMLPTRDKDGINILAITFIIALIFSSLCFSVLNLSHGFLFQKTGYQLLNNYYFIIPITIFLISINRSMFIWLNRKKEYNKIATQNILKSSTNSIASLFLGLKKVNFGLIIGNIISLIIITCTNIFYLSKSIKISSVSSKLMISNFNRYIDFFKFSVPANLFNSLSSLGMTSIIIIFFGPKIAGLYFLAEKLIATPISLITSSISQVYFEEASKLFHSNKRKLLSLTHSLQKNILYILLPFLLFVSLFGENIFVLFGEKWMEAGEILKYFTLYILIKNLYSPISHIGDILNKQKQLLLFNVSLFICQVAAFYFTREYNNIHIALIMSSIIGSLHYILLTIYMKKQLIKLI